MNKKNTVKEVTTGSTTIITDDEVILDLTQEDDSSDATIVESDKLFDELLPEIKINSVTTDRYKSKCKDKPINVNNTCSSKSDHGTKERGLSPHSVDSDVVTDVMALINRNVDSGISSSSQMSIEHMACSVDSNESTTQKRRIVGSRSDIANRKKAKKKTNNVDNLVAKEKLTQEKIAKQATKEINKAYKPGECMKYMIVEIHPNLLTKWYSADIQREVEARGAKVCPCPDLIHPQLVQWTHRIPRALSVNNGQLELTSGCERWGHALYVLQADEVAQHVAENALAQHVAGVQKMVDAEITLVVYGLKDYLKSPKRKGSKNDNKPLVTEIKIEMAFVDLMVSARCDCSVVNTPSEFALLIAHFTKAIAEAPYKLTKRECDERAEFYMKGDNKKCVAVDKNGHGLSRLWQQMVAVLPLSSLDTARTLCKEYKSPLELYQALQQSGGVSVLSQLGVSRAAVPESRVRRIGPEFARRLHTLFTADDGDTLF